MSKKYEIVTCREAAQELIQEEYATNMTKHVEDVMRFQTQLINVDPNRMNPLLLMAEVNYLIKHKYE